MDRADQIEPRQGRAERPPSWPAGGQLKLGLMEESKKETLLEDLFSFCGGLFSYVFRRVVGLGWGLISFIFSGFTLTEQFKFWLSRRFVRRKGQLAFPFAHVTLVGVSLSLLVATAGLGGFIFQNPQPISSDSNPFMLNSINDLITEESKLTRTESFTYAVEESDDIYKIAERFRRTVDALASANRLQESRDGVYIVKPGDILIISPIEGVDYTVRQGDTLATIARKFDSNAQQIVEFNYIMSPEDIHAGMRLMVPVESSYLAGGFSNPVGACGPVSLGWPTRNRTVIGSYVASHRGIDLAADFEPLYAVADGVVTAVANSNGFCRTFSKSCNYGYGGLVFIDIGDGYQVRYGHISKPEVGVGQLVKKGDLVAISGESGVAFGPHLHFELYCGAVGQRINPLPYLE